MATYTNFKVWFWDDSLAALGSTTNVISARYKCVLDNIGEGEFTIPLVDTKTRQWTVKYNIATFTCEINGNQVCFGEIVIDRADEVIVRDGPDLLVVKGLGRMSKLNRDRMNWQIISDGAGGTTTTAVSDILALSQYATWNVGQIQYGAGFVDAASYLVTANETLLDAITEALHQNNHHWADIPGYGLDSASSETPENRFIYIYEMDQLDPDVSGGWGSWYFLETADPTDNYEMPILAIKKILEEKEVVTNLYVYGGGLGSGIFTFTQASATKSPPAGFSYNFTSSIITNTTLEATSNQPRITDVANLSNIKPQDPTNSTSVVSAAEQLVDAGQRWIEERAGGYDTYYRIHSLARWQTVTSRSRVLWPGQDSVRLTWTETSPYDTADAKNVTTIINIDSAFHVLEVEYTATAGTDGESMKLMGDYLIGPAPRQERSFADMVADEVKELKRRLDHADASAGTSNPPASQTYVTTDAPLVTASASAALANERVLTAGDGIDVTDGGAGTTITVAVDVTDILGNGLTETSNNIVLGTPTTLTVSTTNNVGASTHAHAITTSSDATAAVILAADANGRLGLEGLGVGTAAAADNFVLFPTAGGVGLATNAGRLIFVDAATDILRVLDADLHMNDGSNDTLQFRSSGDVGTEADILALGDLGIAAQDDFWLYIDSNNGTTNAAWRIGKDAETSGGSTEIHAISEDGSEEWRSGVAHGMTDLARTADWAKLEENQTDNGGALFRGLTDSSNTAAALRLSGVQANSPDTTDTSSSFAAVNIEGSIKSTTTQADMGSTDNVCAIKNRFTTRFLVKGNGDVHVTNTTLVALDWLDDVALARQLQIELSGGNGILPSPIDEGIVYSRKDLEAAGVLRGEFINVQGTINALLGAIVQLGSRVMQLEARLTDGN